MKLGRRRIRNKHYPQHLHKWAGWFYYIIYINKKYKFLPLKTRDEGVALKRWAEIEAFYRKQKGSFDLKRGIDFKDVVSKYALFLTV